MTVIRLCAALLLVLISSSALAGVDILAPERAHVGEPILIRAVSAAPVETVTITWLGRTVEAPVASYGDGHAATVLLGSDVKYTDPGGEEVAAVFLSGGASVSASRTIELYRKDYPEQRLTVAKDKVNPPAETMARIREESSLVKKALSTVSGVRHWELPLVRPVSGGISSIYGLRRFFNDQERSPHRGLDLRGAAGTPVRSAAAGRVILTGDHYFAGKSVYVDHGLGLVTAYFHLSDIAVSEGEAVSAGALLGSVGSTGRVTGPHLHFGVYALGQAVDPEPLFSLRAK
jgi:murein DD-endopeptidase MepM/ murein hydrolase activator NlpD